MLSRFCNGLCRWTRPEVAILGADQKERGLWGREWLQRSTPIPEKTGSCMQARLNSPRGKFETTWRASKEGQEQVELSPEGHSWHQCRTNKEIDG